MKLLIGTVVLITIGIAIVAGIESYLSIDDLKDCRVPDGLVAKCLPADAIIAISGGDTPARASEAIALYKDGWAPRLIFSGAALDPDSPSNAAAMKRQARAADVPEKAILIDEDSKDTIENAALTKELVGDAKRVILVTSPYHQRRASIEFEKAFGSDVVIVNHPTSSDKFWPNYWWTTPNGWWLALGEMVKTSLVSLR